MWGWLFGVVLAHRSVTGGGCCGRSFVCVILPVAMKFGKETNLCLFARASQAA